MFYIALIVKIPEIFAIAFAKKKNVRPIRNKLRKKKRSLSFFLFFRMLVSDWFLQFLFGKIIGNNSRILTISAITEVMNPSRKKKHISAAQKL
jgi:hypothetical protein